MNELLSSENRAWKGRISNHLQLGGIETSVLDNGAGRGTRIAWFNTGAGIRLKIVPDRGMDIVDAFFNAHSLAWISEGGISFPQPFSDRGIGWLRTFAGGLMTTCGLAHAGVPDNDEFGERGLHGLISNTAAEIVSVIQPDLVRGNMQMSITGLMKETSVLGYKLELRRTISGELGSNVWVIDDEVTNTGNQPAPHMLLYHLNFGWPLVDTETEILWKGNWRAREEASEFIFKEGLPFHHCKPPLDEHNGFGEAAAFIDADTDENGMVNCGLYNRSLGILLAVTYSKSQMPCLTNWQHWGKNEYVTGLEPATNFPVGQAAARKANQLLFLEPGESKKYSIKMSLLTDTEAIKNFRNISI